LPFIGGGGIDSFCSLTIFLNGLSVAIVASQKVPSVRADFGGGWFDY
jgi:hypothetical protein